MKWLVLISLVGAVISLGTLSSRVAETTTAMYTDGDREATGDTPRMPPMIDMSGMGALRAQLRVGNLDELMKLSICRASLLGIRVAITDHHGRTGRYPTTRELSRRGLVLDTALPENPFVGINRVQPVTRAQAGRRAALGGNHGWAYYDGSRGGTAVVYANSDVVGENGW